MVIARKKDSSLRLCPDYRKLNKVTIFDPGPIPDATNLIQQMGKAKYFSKLDLCNGYWQFKMNEDDIEKTAFVTPEGHFEFLKMTFELVNSGATCVRAVKKILGDLENVGVYIDDIIIFTATLEDHLETVKKVLQRLEDHNLTIKPEKCSFGYSEIEFIGHKIKDGSHLPMNCNVDKIREAKRPNTKKKIQSFLGLRIKSKARSEGNILRGSTLLIGRFANPGWHHQL